MSRHHVFLVAIATLLVITGNTSVAKEIVPSRTLSAASVSISRHSIVGGHNDANTGRSLRGGKTIGAEDNKQHSSSGEERAGGLSFLTKLKMKAKVQLWLKLRRPEDYVKKALGLDKLSEAAIKQHPNYKYFLTFKRTSARHQIGTWLEKDTPTSTVWGYLELESVPLKELKNNPGFDNYLSYMLSFERRNAKTGVPLVAYGTKGNEMLVKTLVWAAGRKSEAYVMKALGLTGLTPKMLERHEGLPYYNRFVELAEVVKKMGKNSRVMDFLKILFDD
uniref:RxLR effector protein n=1 Tax=Phytophthora agathidicida TaxID=1642459 RepID=A0A7G4WI03_9STRA|nr:PaRXLR14 [Phytophthora agathidicida]